MQDQPDWAFSWEQRRDGRTVLRDEEGEPLVALAVNRADLGRLESGLRGLADSPAVQALRERLTALHADLGESAQ